MFSTTAETRHMSLNHRRHSVYWLGGLLCSRQSPVDSTHVIMVVSTKWHLDPSSHLVTVDMGQKWGGGGAVVPFSIVTRSGARLACSGVSTLPRYETWFWF